MYKKELLQKLSASWVSCMVMMVEGNLLALNAKHCLIALKSSLGAIQESALLSVCMTAVDVTVHPSHFGAWWTEAVATGIAAGVINYGVTLLSRTKNL
jgi:hypothetical protein